MQELEFYDRTALDYAARTRDLDMSDVREAFLEAVGPTGRLLDAGCGSGRDVAAFYQAGYHVVAFDGSARMAALASDFTGLPVQHLRFDELAWSECFDGVWACASLVHLDDAALVDAVRRLLAALKPGGVLFACMKKGAGASVDGHGRTFNNVDEERFTALVRASGADVTRTWVTGSVAVEGTEWVNLLARRP